MRVPKFFSGRSMQRVYENPLFRSLFSSREESRSVVFLSFERIKLSKKKDHPSFRSKYHHPRDAREFCPARLDEFGVHLSIGRIPDVRFIRPTISIVGNDRDGKRTIISFETEPFHDSRFAIEIVKHSLRLFDDDMVGCFDLSRTFVRSWNDDFSQVLKDR